MLNFGHFVAAVADTLEERLEYSLNEVVSDSFEVRELAEEVDALDLQN